MVFAIFLGAEVFTVSSTAREEFTVSVVTEQVVVFATKFIEIVVAMAIRQELLVVFVFEFIIEVVVVTGWVDTTFTMVVATITTAIVVHIVAGTTNST